MGRHSAVDRSGLDDWPANEGWAGPTLVRSHRVYTAGQTARAVLGFVALGLSPVLALGLHSGAVQVVWAHVAR